MNRVAIHNRSDRSSSREMWIRELKKINFIDEDDDFYYTTEWDDYSEESYP